MNDSDKASEADNTSLIPSSIKDYEIEIDQGGLKVPVRVQYSVQGQTIFVLPVWVAGNVEKVIGDQATPCKPNDRVLPSGENRELQLFVSVRNLLENSETEKIIVNQLRQRVIDQQGLEETARLRIERPNIDTAGIRFTLIAPGRGDSTSPAEIAIALPVSRAADGKLIFTVDSQSIRRVEADRRLARGLTLAALTILPSGPMKVRFERLEMDAQLRYLRVALEDFRKRIASVVNPGESAPDLIVNMSSAGTVETRNQLQSLLMQSLEITVSTRQGSTDLPLMPFLEKTMKSMLETSKLDLQNDQQRITFLMDNQVPITATLGEVRKLSRMDESSRNAAFQKSLDHNTAIRDGRKSNYTGGLNVGRTLRLGTLGESLSGGLSGNYVNENTEQGEISDKRQQTEQKAAFDKLMEDFEGKMPTLTGIAIDDETLTKSTKQVEARFQQSSFFVDFTRHRFSGIHLSGALAPGLSLSDLLRDYVILKNDYEALQKLLGTPQQLAEAKSKLDLMDKLSTDLQARLAETEKTLAQFQKQADAALAKIEQKSDAALAKVDQADLKKISGGIQQENFKHSEQIQLDIKKLADQIVILKRHVSLKPVVIMGHSDSVTDVNFSPDGNRIITASTDKSVRIWDALTGNEIRILEGHDKPVNCAIFSPDGKKILTGTTDGKACIWDTVTGMQVRLIQVHGQFNSIVGLDFFDPEGTKIVIAQSDKEISIWNSVTGMELPNELEKLNDRKGFIYAMLNSEVSVSRDEKLLVISKVGEKSPVILDAATGKQLQILEGHNDQVLCVAISPDSKKIATSSSDKTARIWDAATGKELQRLEGHLATVHSVVFSPDGSQVATASGDGTARIWIIED